MEKDISILMFNSEDPCLFSGVKPQILNGPQLSLFPKMIGWIAMSWKKIMKIY